MNKYENFEFDKKEWVHQVNIHYNIYLEDTILSSSNKYIKTFDLIQRVARLVRTARIKTKTHTSSKTPIKRLEICMDNPRGLEMIASCIDVIQSELNVIDIAYLPLEETMIYRIIPNKAIIGKKYKKQANDIYKALDIMPNIHKNIKESFNVSLDGNINININPDEYTLEPVFNDNDIFEHTNTKELNMLLRIDFTYNAAIESIAIVRRLISHIQQSRKIAGCHPWNPICIIIYNDDFNIVSNNQEFIAHRLECNIKIDSNKPDSNKPDSNKPDSNKSDSNEYIFTLLDDSRTINYIIERL